MIYIAFTKCKNTPASQHEAGVAMRNMLFEAFSVTDEVKTTENGKPYIDNTNIFFSISHSECVSVCALRCKDEKYDLPDNVITIFENGEGEIGIDIEAIPSPDTLEKKNKTAKRFFGETFESINDYVRKWTQTEAFAKLCDIPLAKAFNADMTNFNFFISEIDFNNRLYAISVCYK